MAHSSIGIDFCFNGTGKPTLRWKKDIPFQFVNHPRIQNHTELACNALFSHLSFVLSRPHCVKRWYIRVFLANWAHFFLMILLFLLWPYFTSLTPPFHSRVFATIRKKKWVGIKWTKHVSHEISSCIETLPSDGRNTPSRDRYRLTFNEHEHFYDE